MVRRYGSNGKKQVKYWEILNEPNLSSRTYDYKEYLDLLKITYPIIKKEDPQSKILLAGLTSKHLYWLDYLLIAGGGDYFDILSFHVYDKPENVGRSISTVKAILENKNLNKAIWVTEINWGWWNYLTPAKEDKCGQPDDEIKWLVFEDFFENSFEAGADKVFWHQARCFIWGPGFIEDRSELVNSPRIIVRTVSFNAFKDAVRLFTPTTIHTQQDFSISKFEYRSITGGYSCSIDYNNQLEEKAVLTILYTNTQGKVISAPAPIVDEGTGEISTNFYCNVFEAGTYRVSWIAYRKSDSILNDPVAWSSSNLSLIHI